MLSGRALVFAVSAAVLFTASAYGQSRDSIDERYRRSSLCVLLMDETGMPMRDVIKQAFVLSPIPDKYNDHNIEERIIDLKSYRVTDRDRAAFEAASCDDPSAAVVSAGSPRNNGALGGVMKSMLGLPVITGGNNSTMNGDDYAVAANMHIVRNNVAKQLVDNWFIAEDSLFSMERVRERGLYAASALDIEMARSSVRGMAMLEDAGEELIGNTFVVVSRYRYLSKDELVAEIGAIARAAAQLSGNQYVQLGASAATLAIKASLGAGYYVRTTSYLFKLRWNRQVASEFYTRLWGDREAYDSTELFSLQYIGSESAWANVKESIFTTKPRSELVRIATVNASDAAIAKLAKNNDVFKTKTPLIVADGAIYARIGMKEGLEAGDRFEVLERIFDERTGRTSYRRRGVVKVSRNQIWDNRYMADEELRLSGREQGFDMTRFVGSTKGLYSGMLLRQIK